MRTGNLLKEAAAVMRLVLKLGVFDRESREFWTYSRQVLSGHRSRFAHAMVLAAMRCHFRLLTEDMNRIIEF